MKAKQISKQIKLKKEFILIYQQINKKPIKIKGYGIKSRHKCCTIGKLMDDLLGDSNKIMLKNLKKISPYSIQQPDTLLISIYLIIKIANEKQIIKNYLSKVWFSYFSIKTEGKDLMEVEFPWGFLETDMPFDERICNVQYRSYIFI